MRTEQLNDYIAGRGGTPSYRHLSRLVDKYEWFTTARRARALVSGERDLALVLPLGFWPTVAPEPRGADVVTPPAPLHGGPQACDSAGSELKNTAPNDLIDRFISSGGDRRIVPANDEVAAARVDIEIDPEMVSPELAEIYRSQGLTEKADEIYRLLNLQNR